MMRVILYVLVLIATACLGRTALSFNEAGHMIVAKMAHDQLSDAQRAAAFAILQNHPHREEHFDTERPDGVDEKEWYFLRAATWSDFVRPPPNTPQSVVVQHPIWKYHRGPWHYINYPYKNGDQVPMNLPPAMHIAEPNHTDVLLQIPISISVVKDPTTTDPGRQGGISDAQNRAVRLCWILHLLGDVHQPLHVTALVDDSLLPGSSHDDQGGNLFTVRLTADGPGNKLHSYWDGRISGNNDYDSVKAVAEDMWSNPAHAPANFPQLTEHTTPTEWAEEGYRLAIADSYKWMQLVPWQDIYKHADSVPPNTPVLTAEYKANSQRVARSQGVLAARRLVKLLTECLGE
jgi:hypothetical protein